MSAPIESPYVESPSAESVDVAIVGGGISGLATAHRLRELAPQLSVVVLESRNRLGGVLETVREAGFLLEGGPDNFITNVPWAVDLCRRIGFAEQLITTNPDQRNAFVVRRGKLEKIPPGFVVMAPSRLWPLVSTPILSPWGKLRMAGEYIVPARRDAGDESLAAFVRRRFGREVYDRLVQPLVGGIYTGDPEQLSLQATLPRFQEMERKHGGLIRGMRKSSHGGNPTNYQRNDTTPPNKTQDSGGRYSLFVAPRDGATSLVDAIAGRLEPHTIRLNSPVANVSHLPSGGWAIDLADKDTRQIRSQHLVLATPARLTASLLKPTLPRLANDLEKIQYSGCTLVSLG
ncbi:MAG: protoporphyrinogen oxidase, partial [Planctomycetales bacterium]|nr:protoporphyrinogen oxidase [Planctomycetales bacterium]